MSRGTWVLLERVTAFAYGAITVYGRPFQAVRLTVTFVTPISKSPTTPSWPKSSRFGLFPVRSPLLRESRLISFPQGTEMFHFPWFASYGYVFSIRW